MDMPTRMPTQMLMPTLVLARVRVLISLPVTTPPGAMHSIFQKHLRPDGRGVDVTDVSEQEVAQAIGRQMIDDIAGPLRKPGKQPASVDELKALADAPLDELALLQALSPRSKVGDAPGGACGLRGASAADGPAGEGSDVEGQLLHHIQLYDPSLMKNASSGSILCMIYSKNSPQSARAAAATWLRQCDGALIFTRSSDNALPMEQDPHEPGSWAQSKAIWLRVHQKLRSRYTFFLFATDESYVLMPNLRAFLASPGIRRAQAAGDPLYMGRRLALWGNADQVFNSGGAAYILNAASLRLLAGNIIHDEDSCRAESDDVPGDVQVSVCLKAAGVTPRDSRDEGGRERFHPLSPEQHMRFSGDRSHWLTSYAPGLSGGLGCCSTSSVSFHSLTATDITRVHAAFVLAARTQCAHPEQ